MSRHYSKGITVEIRKKGRKYFKIAYPGAENEFDLVINLQSEKFKLGESSN